MIDMKIPPKRVEDSRRQTYGGVTILRKSVASL